MRLKRKGFLPQNTESGQVEWAAGVFLLLFLGVLLCSLLQADIFRSSSQYLEDALALSNLASAVIDVEEYGISHKVLITDYQGAYERYKMAVKGNLNLNDGWECPQRAMISGPVKIVKYILYNVNGRDVDICYFDENGLMTQWTEQLGSARAPNGMLIEATGVYSEISYWMDGLLGIHTEAWKGKLVDIVAKEGEGEGDTEEDENHTDESEGDAEADRDKADGDKVEKDKAGNGDGAGLAEVMNGEAEENKR